MLAEVSSTRATLTAFAFTSVARTGAAEAARPTARLSGNKRPYDIVYSVAPTTGAVTGHCDRRHMRGARARMERFEAAPRLPPAAVPRQRAPRLRVGARSAAVAGGGAGARAQE